MIHSIDRYDTSETDGGLRLADLRCLRVTANSV